MAKQNTENINTRSYFYKLTRKEIYLGFNSAFSTFKTAIDVDCV